MSRTNIVGRIEKEIEQLSPQEQLRLVEKLAHQLRKSAVTRREGLDWRGLYGLGKGPWNGEDAQAYVERLREERA
ncbi:MAG: hypothetical protein HYX92_02255 [Chloroflexi bacterium]|nr:hypothetical protein [Chloroflexota bacterium]